MRKFVAEQAVLPEGDKNGGGLDRGYIIRPTNSLLKFIHNDDQNDEIGPMFEASFEVCLDCWSTIFECMFPSLGDLIRHCMNGGEHLSIHVENLELLDGIIFK